MSKVQTFIQSLNYEQKLSFEEMKEKLTSAPYFLVIKESHNWPDLFLITISNKTDLTDCEMKDIYNQCVGVIVNKNNYKIVSHSYNRVFELKEVCNTENNEDYETFMSEKVSHIEILEEGTFIRVFWYENKWIVSTLKCIDTTETFIPNTKKNFTDMFYEAAKDLDLEKWDKNMTYCFVLKHPENRCIINYKDHPVLIYIGKCNNQTYEQIYEKDFSHLLKTEDNLVKSKSWDEIMNEDYENKNQKEQKEQKEHEEKETYAMKIINQKKDMITKNKKSNLWIRCVSDYKQTTLSSILNIVEKRKLNTHKGFLLYLKDGSRVSLVFKEYNELLLLRGTNPDIRIRYLELSQDKREKLSQYFPEYNLSSIEQEINNKAAEIFKIYKAINIYKTLSFEQAGKLKKIIYYLHTYYKTTRCPITLKITIEKLKSLDSKNIAWILNWI